MLKLVVDFQAGYSVDSVKVLTLIWHQWTEDLQYLPDLDYLSERLPIGLRWMSWVANRLELNLRHSTVDWRDLMVAAGLLLLFVTEWMVD